MSTMIIVLIGLSIIWIGMALMGNRQISDDDINNRRK